MRKEVFYFAIVRGVKEPYAAIVTTRDELMDMRLSMYNHVIEFPMTKDGAKLFCDIAKARGIGNHADYLVAKYL